MINLSDHLITPETAIRLKELGVPQKSVFYWENINGTWRISQMLVYAKKHGFDYYSAYLVSELGEILQDWIGLIAYFEGWNDDGRHEGMDDGRNWYVEEHGIYEKKEIEVRAKLLIYLLENKLIKI